MESFRGRETDGEMERGERIYSMNGVVAANRDLLKRHPRFIAGFCCFKKRERHSLCRLNAYKPQSTVIIVKFIHPAVIFKKRERDEAGVTPRITQSVRLLAANIHGREKGFLLYFHELPPLIPACVPCVANTKYILFKRSCQNWHEGLLMGTAGPRAGL